MRNISKSFLEYNCSKIEKLTQLRNFTTNMDCGITEKREAKLAPFLTEN